MKTIGKLFICLSIGSLGLSAFNLPQSIDNYANVSSPKTKGVKRVEYKNYKFGDVIKSKEILYLPFALKDANATFTADFGRNDNVLFLGENYPELVKNYKIRKEKLLIYNLFKNYQLFAENSYISVNGLKYISNKWLAVISRDGSFYNLRFVNIQNLYKPEFKNIVKIRKVECALSDDGVGYFFTYNVINVFKDNKLYYKKTLKGYSASKCEVKISRNKKYFYVLTPQKFYVIDKKYPNHEKVTGSLPLGEALSMLVDENRKRVYISAKDMFYNVDISDPSEPDISYGLEFKDKRLKGTDLLSLSKNGKYFYALDKDKKILYKVSIEKREIIQTKKLFDKKIKKGINSYSEGEIVYFKVFNKKPEVLFIIKRDVKSLSLKGKNGKVYEIDEVALP